MRTERTDAMDRLKPRSKATKLRPLMRLIEAKIEEGVQHADILQWLHREGLVCRRHKILLDIELARFYGVPTKRLNEQVRRNRERFPEDFMFQVSIEEFEALRSQFTTSNAASGRGGRRYRPYAFTEHGALMAANVLNSARAIEVSVYVVRAFMRLRETLAAHKDLAKTLQQLEKKTEALTLQHDTLAANTRAQFKQVFDALRALMTSPEPKKRPIGFVTSKEKQPLKTTPPLRSNVCGNRGYRPRLTVSVTVCQESAQKSNDESA